MSEKIKKHWSRSPWFYIPTGLFVVLLVVVFILIHQLENIVEANLRSALADQTETTHEIDFQSLHIRLLQNSIKLKNITVTPRAELIKQQEEQGIYSSAISTASVEMVSLKGFDWELLLSEKKIHLNELVINKPEFSFYLTGNKKKNTKELTDTLSVADQISNMVKLLDSVHVEEVYIKNGKFDLYRPDSSQALAIEELGMEIIGADYDSTLDDGLPVRFEKLLITTGAIRTKVSDEYNLSTKKVALNFTDSFFLVENLAIVSPLSRKEFVKKQKFEKTQMTLDVGSIEGKGIDIRRIILEEYIHIQSIQVKDLNFSGFKDKSPPWNSLKKAPILSQLVPKIPFGINVEQIHVSNSNVQFEQVMAEHEQPGKLLFTECFASVYNLTNDPRLLKKSDRLTVDFAGKLMNSGRLNINLQFSLSGRADRFFVKGKLDKMPLASLNDELEPLIGVEISSGVLHSALIDLNGNNRQITGTVNLHYNDVLIDVLKLKPESTDKETSRFFSFVANTVVRRNNVPGTDSYKEGFVNYVRTPDIPFFKFLWEGLFSGIRNTLIGVKTKQEKNLQRDRNKKKGNSANSSATNSDEGDTTNPQEGENSGGIKKLFRKIKKKGS